MPPTHLPARAPVPYGREVVSTKYDFSRISFAVSVKTVDRFAVLSVRNSDKETPTHLREFKPFYMFELIFYQKMKPHWLGG